MRLENDKVFNELYDEQFEMIPFVFRFSRRRFYISLGIMAALLITIVVFIVKFYQSGHFETVFNVYDDSYAYAVVLTGIALAAVAGWVSIAKWFEDRAFKKASNLAQMIHLSEQHRNALIWHSWKAENRMDF